MIIKVKDLILAWKVNDIFYLRNLYSQVCGSLEKASMCLWQIVFVLTTKLIF